VLYRALSTGEAESDREIHRGPIAASSATSMPVSDPKDPHEREAEEVAERLTGPTGSVTPGRGSRTLNRSADPAAAAGTASPVPPGPGRRLPASARSWAEPKFGTSFDAVRVHTDGAAARAADGLSAHAFTVGNDITFAAGQFAPETPTGRRLLAHELTHVLQRHDPTVRATALRQTRTPTVAPVEPPDVILKRATDQLDTLALPNLQQALDAVNEPGVRMAGMSVAALCAAIDRAYHEAVPPPAPGQDPAPVLIGPPAPGPAGTRDRAVLEYQRAAAMVSDRLTTQRFRGQPVLPGRAIPASALAGDLAPYAIRRTDLLAWVVRDAAALVALLRRDTLAVGDEWTAIGLLRQHLNPWDFTYLLTVVGAERLRPRLERFGPGPIEAFRSLSTTVAQIRSTTETGPADEPGLLEVRATEGTIRLLQPLSGAEVAKELYGDADTFAELVVAYNRQLKGQDPARWLPTGTVLVVAAEQLTPGYRSLYGYARQMRTTRERSGSEPYLSVQPGDDTVAVGNTVRFGVVWPNSLFANVKLNWWIENDPVAVREQRVAARVEGPTGTLSMVPEQTRDASIQPTATAPGHHTIKCELTESTGHRRVLERSVTVLTLEEKIAAESRRDLGWTARPGSMVEELRKQRDKMAQGSKQRKQLDDRIAEIERTLAAADQDQRRYRGHDAHLSGVRALYVSAEGLPMSVPLNIFVDSDPGYFDAPDYVLKLWDFTLQGSIRTYQGRAAHPQEALVSLLRTFADDAPYPTGAIRFEITPATMGYREMRRETLVCRTDGGTKMAGALRALSMGFMGLGVVSAIALQAEIAIPAFAIAGVLAGAGGAFSLYDRLEHGDFAWDLQTGLDLLDIAGAVLTVGVSSGGTAVARGVGKLSMGARAQLAVGSVQIAVMAGVHVAHIEEAIRSGDRDRVARALLSALADGALILIVHRAASRLGGAQRGPREGPGPARKPPESATPRPTTGNIPPEGQAQTTKAQPGTPEHRQQVHDQWVENLRQTGLVERAATPAAAEPLRPRDDIPTIEEAHRVYEDLLARDATREVGIFRNSATGNYAVRVGSEMSVAGPTTGHWDSVLHYHPNEANVLTHRMPAPADVRAVSTAAERRGVAVTELVDFPLPGGGRARCAYRASPTGEVTVEFARPDGTRVSRSFANIGDYQRAYGARTTYLDPNSPEYRWVVEDLHDYYGGEGVRPGGERTARGTARPPGEPTAREVETAARRESMAYWQEPGRTTETQFARHEQTFNSIAATLRNAIQALRTQGRGNLLPHLNEAVLQEPVDHFIRQDPRLGPMWAQMERDARSNPGLRREMNTFLEGALEGGGSRQVGARKPDLVEFFLEHGDVVVTDIVYSNDGNYLRVHAFKTDFYRGVVTRMIGGTGGPRVSGLDLNLRPAIPESKVTP
jgi:hypothetical protein